MGALSVRRAGADPRVRHFFALVGVLGALGTAEPVVQAAEPAPRPLDAASGLTAVDAVYYGDFYAKRNDRDSALWWYNIAKALLPSMGGVDAAELDARIAAVRDGELPDGVRPAPRYRGFGGVSYGFVQYVDAPVASGEQLRFSEEGKFSQAIGSEFLLRVGDSRWFAGYAVAVQGGSSVSRELRPAVVGAQGASQACYGDLCYGATTVNYFDVLHVPVEANTAYVIDGGRLNFFIGGGPSLHVAKVSGYRSESVVQIFELYGTAQDNVTTSSATSAFGGQTRSYGIGGQVFAGTAVELGELPRLGGRWGLSLNMRYQKVRDLTMELSGEDKFTEYKTDGTVCDAAINPDDSCPPESFVWSEKVAIDGDNWGARLGLVFFF